MSGRKKLDFGLLILALVGFWFWCLPGREPEYQGKPMSWWLEQPMDGTNLDAYIATGEAMQHFSSAVVPELLDQLESDSKETLVKQGKRFVGRSGYQLGAAPDPAGQLARQDSLAQKFLAMGERADPAVPRLAQLVRNGTPLSCAGEALGFIGTTNALTALKEMLVSTNEVEQLYGLAAISFCGSRAEEVVPRVLPLLTASDPKLRANAVAVLRAVAVPQLRNVAALTNLLTDPSALVRRGAGLALGELGEAAGVSVPVLARALGVAGLETAAGQQALQRSPCEIRDVAIVRGPKDKRRIALVFTGHEFAEGGETILNALSSHHAKTSFFLTGAILDHTNFAPLIQRMLREGHYVGMHSDQHLLYCSWDRDRRTLVSRWDFQVDLMRNAEKLARITGQNFDFQQLQALSPYFLPPYEHYNRDIADWSRGLGLTLINYTPGTRSNADYTEDGAPNFVSSQKIFDSILAREQSDPHGLNGFILLLHLGAGPKRTDKFHPRLPELLDTLAARGYQFVRVNELLAPPASQP